MIDQKIIDVLKRYDEIAGLILEQKVDEFADKMDEKPPEEDDVTYEQYLHRVAMQETEEQSLLMEAEPQEALGGLSMNEFFAKLSFAELTEILEYCATELDRGVPASVVNALVNIDDAAMVEGYARTMVRESAWRDEEMDNEDKLFEMEFQKVKASLKILSGRHDATLLDDVLDRFMSYERTHSFVADSIAEYIESFPDEAPAKLIDRLKEHMDDGMEGPCEDLVVMLTNIGKEKKSEQIYDALRMAFRSMTNKIYAVICFADYGDDRAVPLMKNYINRHQTDIPRELFYEMMSAIQNLGGDIEDISDPFGDFTKKG
ncbi:MAG: hypothetical protein IK142_08515 [Clostridiales bacterium]|jgi:hypothetical protein|nr:hypothetical protein [Clostridiales bacterium]